MRDDAREVLERRLLGQVIDAGDTEGATMPVGMDQLTNDLTAETEVLRALLVGLPDADWELATPAEGWAVRDQISHLAYFDDAAVRSATDPDGFQAELRQLVQGGGILAGRHRRALPRPAAGPAARLVRRVQGPAGQHVSPRSSLVPGWPWYGPPMSAASSVTARLMETWAHGQDAVDGLGAGREPSQRLRHVAHIGVRAMPFSYALHGRQAPDTPVRVELTAPGGEL